MEMYVWRRQAAWFCGAALVLTSCLPDFVTVPSAGDVIAEGQGPAGLTLSSEPTPWQANLQWSDRSQIETSYHVQRRMLDEDSVPNTEYADVGTAVVNQIWWADQNVETDTTYEYRVEAFQGVVSLGMSDSIEAKIPTYLPVTTHEYGGPITYDAVVFSLPQFGYPTVIYDAGASGIYGYYMDSQGFSGNATILDVGLGRYDSVEKTHRLWWDGDTLFRVADMRTNSGVLYTALTGWHRTGSRLQLARKWGAIFTHVDGTVYGSSVFGTTRTVFKARTGSLCPIVMTDGNPPATNSNIDCMDETLAASIVNPRSMIAFDSGKGLYLSTDNGSLAINIEAPGLMTVLASSANAPVITQYDGTGDYVWGRTTTGNFVAFENRGDYLGGAGPELDTELELTPGEYQYTANDGSRQFTLSCSQGAEIFWNQRVLQAIPLEHCAVAAVLLNSTSLWILTDTGKLVTYDLSPRFGSWTGDRRR